MGVYVSVYILCIAYENICNCMGAYYMCIIKYGST